MRTRNLAALATGVALVAASLVSARADEASVRKEMKADFDKAVKAFRAKDIKGFMAMIADDFHGKGMDGKPMTKASMEAEMKQHMAETKTLDTADLTIDKIKTDGKTATTDSTLVLKMHVVDSKGEMGPKGKEHVMDMVEKSHETWVKGKGGWLEKTSEPLPGGKMMMDGKPFMPGPPPKPAKPNMKTHAK